MSVLGTTKYNHTGQPGSPGYPGDPNGRGGTGGSGGSGGVGIKGIQGERGERGESGTPGTPGRSFLNFNKLQIIAFVILALSVGGANYKVYELSEENREGQIRSCEILNEAIETARSPEASRATRLLVDSILRNDPELVRPYRQAVRNAAQATGQLRSIDCERAANDPDYHPFR